MSSAPILAIVLAVRIAVAIMNAQKKGPSGEGGGTSNNVSLATVGVVLAALFWVPALLFFLAMIPKWGIAALPWIILFGLLVSPYVAARYVFVPLGLARTAARVSRLPTITWSVDSKGGACLMAAWALLRSKRDDDAAIEWITSKLAEAKPLRGAGIVASGLLLAKHGDLQGAREVLESVETIDEKICPPMALRISREWRAADAAARGDWSTVEDLAILPGAKSRLVRLLGAIAAHLMGSRPLGAARAWALWIVAPRRLHTRTFVASALARPVGACAKDTRPAPMNVFLDEVDGPLVGAMRFHAALLGRDPSRLDARDVLRLAELWEAAIAELSRSDRVQARAIALGAVRWEQAINDVTRQAEEELARAIRAAKIPLARLPADGNGLLSRARRAVRHELLVDLEVTAEGLRTRTRALQELDPPDEWREWIERRRTFDRAIAQGGAEVLRLAFPVLNPAVTNYAVWLFNVRKERAIANAIFRWIKEHAELVGDGEALGLATSNVECGAA